MSLQYATFIDTLGQEKRLQAWNSRSSDPLFCFLVLLCPQDVSGCDRVRIIVVNPCAKSDQQKKKKEWEEKPE